MKKVLCLFAAVAVAAYLGLLPFKATDVADLIPAQTAFIMKDGTTYTVDVGAGVSAIGNTLKKALAALQEQTAGTVYFGTCEQLVLLGDTEALLPEIAGETDFRPAAGVYTASEMPDADAVSSYLHNHHGDLTINDVKAALAAGEKVMLPQIVPAGGGFRILA